MNKIGKIVCVGALLISGYTLSILVRDPILPPKTEFRPSIQRIAEGEDLENTIRLYSGKAVEVKSKPVHVWYDGGYDLEIGLQEGDHFLKAQSAHLLGSILRCRRRNDLSDEKLKDVYELLKQRISAGDLDTITLRGRFDSASVLKIYGVSIDGKDYDLLRYTENR